MSEEKEKPLEKMTIKALHEIALQLPHEHLELAVHDMNKEQVIAFIKKSRGIQDEPQESTHKKKKKAPKAKVILSRQEIKQLIRKLKEEKAALGGSAEKDNKSISILRRRISRLKKQSRKAA